MSEQTLDMGKDWQLLLPFVVVGTAVGKGNSFNVREKRKQYNRLYIEDLRLARELSFEKITGKKVKVTIEVLE